MSRIFFVKFSFFLNLIQFGSSFTYVKRHTIFIFGRLSDSFITNGSLGTKTANVLQANGISAFCSCDIQRFPQNILNNFVTCLI